MNTRTGIALCALALLQACATTVDLQMPRGPLHVGSYARIPVRLPPGMTLDDLKFKVSDSPAGGEVSLSRDETFDPGRPEIMLLVGYEPGAYTVEVYHKSQNPEVDAPLREEEFEVSATWPSASTGPSIWISGVVERPRGVPGAEWGGGPSGAHYYMATPRPVPPEWHTYIVPVDTAQSPYLGAELGTVLGTWWAAADEAAKYFDEVSYQQFKMTVHKDLTSKYQLLEDWTHYFELTDDGRWFSTPSFRDECVAAIDGLIPITENTSVVFVVRSSNALLQVWPHAVDCCTKTQGGDFDVHVVVIPHDWPKGRQVLCHEIGHNLGMADLYKPKVDGGNRNVGGWDPMDQATELPHFCLPHRWMLGWVHPNHIATFNFRQDHPSPPPVDEMVKLYPAELKPSFDLSGKPHMVAIEIRVCYGWSYFFEYRKAQSGDDGDQVLPKNNRVLGTDLLSPLAAPCLPDPMPDQRPPIILLRKSQGDGPVLGVGEKYREVDDTSVPFSLLSVGVREINETTANVQIEYDREPSVDPYIVKDSFRSPDIEIENAFTENSALKNVPVKGIENTIVATIHNEGTVAAEKVKANFYAHYANVGIGSLFPPLHLGSDVQDIPANGEAEFKVTFEPVYPPCIEVIIEHYWTPDGLEEELGDNNDARTNYTVLFSVTASAPSREMLNVKVQNPYDKRTRILLFPSQTNPYYRTYLEHKWLELEPGEVKDVLVMCEFAPDGTQVGPVPDQVDSRRPNEIEIASFIYDATGEIDAPRFYSGIEATVLTGRATRVAEFVASGGTVTGKVVTVDTDEPVPGGKVVVVARDAAGKATYETLTLAFGDFQWPLPGDWNTVTAHYVPAAGFGPCESETIAKPTD